MIFASCLLDSPADVAASAVGAAPVSGLYRVRLAAEPWELRAYTRLRYRVFCAEQGLFLDGDADEHDAAAQPIVAVSSASVADDDVVGTVRIHETSKGVWLGSRLAVDPAWRGVPKLASSLIRCAVCTAQTRGCHTFLANVQLQNVPMFRRLNWRTLSEVTICGRPHHLMQADLSFYPPASAPGIS